MAQRRGRLRDARPGGPGRKFRAHLTLQFGHRRDPALHTSSSHHVNPCDPTVFHLCCARLRTWRATPRLHTAHTRSSSIPHELPRVVLGHPCSVSRARPDTQHGTRLRGGVHVTGWDTRAHAACGSAARSRAQAINGTVAQGRALLYTLRAQLRAPRSATRGVNAQDGRE